MDENGKEQLHSLHELVVRGLPSIIDGKNLVQKWRDREIGGGYNYYCAYLHDESGKVVSIVSGVLISEGVARIINTATLPDYRNQGLIKSIIGNLIERQKEIGFGKIDMVLSSSVKPEEVGFGNKMDEFKGIVSRANEIAGREVSDTDLGEFGQYGAAFSRIMRGLYFSDTTEGRVVFKGFKNGQFWQKDNFNIVNGFFDKVPGLGKVNLEVGLNTGNINFVPVIDREKFKELSEKCDAPSHSLKRPSVSRLVQKFEDISRNS